VADTIWLACRYAHAFMVDTGASTGEISGHSKQINAAAIRAQVCIGDLQDW